MTLEEKKKNRFLFLQKLYETTEGSSAYMVNMWELGSELGFDRAITTSIVDYLKEEGLMEPRALGGGISITHHGIVEIEESLSNPNSATEHFPAINLIHIESMNNSAIQQGTYWSSQTANFSVAKSGDWEKLINEIEKIVDQITLDGAVYEELISELGTLKSQIKSPKPKSIILTESLKTVRTIMEGVTGNVAAPLIIEMINNLMR